MLDIWNSNRNSRLLNDFWKKQTIVEFLYRPRLLPTSNWLLRERSSDRLDFNANTQVLWNKLNKILWWLLDSFACHAPSKIKNIPGFTSNTHFGCLRRTWYSALRFTSHFWGHLSFHIINTVHPGDFLIRCTSNFWYFKFNLVGYKFTFFPRYFFTILISVPDL